MEHHPFLSFDNGLEITYSDIKEKKSGSEYITIYFEQPNESGTDFKSAQCDYPCGSFTKIVGYSSEEIDGLWKHVAKAGPLAMSFEKGSKYA
ncbi:MAG: hypothetical protein PUJ25_02270 [Lachnospiraceae bacterium]|mgnify:FL=1|nr:hypothetical protein [Lachnospiraceae bacterium]MDD7664413.1 hypothetical protein [Lachnospiraceae bacterium]MDY4165793.1 hypothetical protein [Lachnospiraceae bacterium]